MSSTTITTIGNVGNDPELRFTSSGKQVASVSVAVNQRRKNERGEWEDSGEVIWYRVNAWGPHAEAVAEHVRKGDRVMVTGQLEQSSFEGRDGERRTSLEIQFATIGVVPRSNGITQQQSQAGDPWGSQQQQPQPQAASGWGNAPTDPPF